jgi:hypothetical protein
VYHDQVRAAFEDPKEFTTSPLYRCLSRTVAATGQLLDLASQGRPGQYPTFLFFGAVHLLLLAGTDHPLARFYPSIAGARALPPEDAGPALVSFGRAHAASLAETIRTRLVQTNQVQRAIGLRLGLSVIADEVPGPVHVIEAGTSAGHRTARRGPALQLRRPGTAAAETIAIVDGHLAWIEMCLPPSSRPRPHTASDDHGDLAALATKSP